MELYLGVVLGLAGVVCILAGVKGRGTDLFTAVTGSAAPPSSTAAGGATGWESGSGGDFGGSFGGTPTPATPHPAAALAGGSGPVMFA